VENNEKKKNGEEGERAKGYQGVPSRMDGIIETTCAPPPLMHHPPRLSSIFRIIDHDYSGWHADRAIYPSTRIFTREITIATGIVRRQKRKRFALGRLLRDRA